MPSELAVPWTDKLTKMYDKLQNVDTLDIVLNLIKKKYISKWKGDSFVRLLKEARKKEQQHDEEIARIQIFGELPYLLVFDQFLSVLVNLKHVVEAIDIQICLGRTGHESPGFSDSQKLYVSLKQNTHNNNFSSPTESLRSLYCTFKQNLEECRQKLRRATNTNERHDLELELQERANKCVACLFAALDAEITRWKSHFTWDENSGPIKGNTLSELFHEVKCLMSDVPNVQIVETGLYSRIAIAYAMSNQLAKADQYITKAYTSSVFIPVCAELEFMLHMFVMIRMFQLERFPTEISFDVLQQIVNKSAHSLDDEKDENVRNFWRRMIMLRYVFCLLGLKNKIEVLRGFDVKPDNISEAKTILADIRRMGRMEARRELFFYAAKARIYELEGDFKSALVNAELAIACDESNCCGETRTLQAYLQQLRQKKIRQDERHNATEDETLRKLQLFEM